MPETMLEETDEITPGGTPLTGNEPVHHADFVRQFREGMPESQRETFDRNFIPKADVTRMQQNKANKIAELEQRQALVEQHILAQRQPGEQKSAVALAMEELGVTEDKAPDVYKLMQKVSEATVKQTVQQFSPFINGVTAAEQNRALQANREDLRKRLGDDVDQYWPEVEQVCRQYFAQGMAVDPEWVLKGRHPQEHEDMVYKAVDKRRRAERKTKTTSSTEGFASFQRSQPLVDGQGGLPAQREPVKDALLTPDKLKSITDEVLKDLGWRK